MAKKVITVSYEVPGYSDCYKQINSKKSLDDADIVIFSPEIDGYYGSDDNWGGRQTYSKDGSFRLAADMKHWREELSNFAASGRTAFIILTPYEEFNLHTGKTEQRYKNQITNIVATHNNYESIPFSFRQLVKAEGETINLATDTSSTFQLPSELKSRAKYSVYFQKSENIKPIFTARDKNRVLGGVTKVGKGNIVFLPNLDYDHDDFTTTKTDKQGKQSTVWSNEAMRFGRALYNFCDSISKELEDSTASDPAPAWVNNPKYATKKEGALRAKVEKLNSEIEKKQIEKTGHENDLINEQKLKGLLYETGKALEASVTLALKILGYQAENYDDGELELDQVINSPEGDRYIGECEGKDNKAINITKFRQLSDSLSADFEREEVTEKAFGIIFGNPFRGMQPEQRASWFTDKAVSGAKREGVALIKTPDLHRVVRYVNDSSDQKFAKQCRDKIKSSLGDIVEFPGIPKKKQPKK